jgi:hypothetical protein
MITAILPSLALMDSPLIPSLFPLSQRDDLIALLPPEAWDDVVVGKAGHKIVKALKC